MTLVMVWREDRAERLWLASDSRLSQPGESGHVRLTDRAAKILETHVVLTDGMPNAPPIAARTLGFAYVGSSLVALQAYSAVLPLWSRLQSSQDQVLPMIGECAEHLAKFVKAYSHEVSGSGNDGNCLCVLTGFNERFPAVEAWLIDARAGASGTLCETRQLTFAPGAMELFGSGRTDAIEELKAFTPGQLGWHREPLEMLRASLKRDAWSDVGGGVQVGMVTNAGFELCFDVQPFLLGQSRFGDRMPPGRVISFAQTDVADRLLSGADAEFVRKSAEFFVTSVKESRSAIVDGLELTGDEAAAATAILDALGAAVSEEYRNKFAVTAREDFQRHFDEMVALMPKQEVLELAEALVSITAIERKASSEQETVGGPVDVALITRNEGFVWIKRKLYFPADLNPRYFWRKFGPAPLGTPR